LVREVNVGNVSNISKNCIYNCSSYSHSNAIFG
jgi:hypothetical protein